MTQSTLSFPTAERLRATSEISLALVLRIDADRPVSDLDRFIALGLPSLRQFLEDDLARELVVVVPPEDLAEVASRLEDAAHLPVRVVDERDVVPLGSGTHGWYKQQLIKLGLPAVVRTPWLITLDADVICTRPIDRDFLLPEGRAIWQQERAGAHLDWWRGSAAVLRSPTSVAPDQPVFGVTPAILHTASLVELTERIEAEYPGRHWTETLMTLTDRRWTEYTLYWTHLLDRGTADVLYAVEHRVPYALTGSIWTHRELMSKSQDLDAIFAPDAPHAFFVFQSNLNLPLSTPVRLLRPYLGESPAITPAEHVRWNAHRTRRVLRQLRAEIGRIVRKATG